MLGRTPTANSNALLSVIATFVGKAVGSITRRQVIPTCGPSLASCEKIAPLSPRPTGGVRHSQDAREPETHPADCGDGGGAARLASSASSHRRTHRAAVPGVPADAAEADRRRCRVWQDGSQDAGSQGATQRRRLVHAHGGRNRSGPVPGLDGPIWHQPSTRLCIARFCGPTEKGEAERYLSRGSFTRCATPTRVCALRPEFRLWRSPGSLGHAKVVTAFSVYARLFEDDHTDAMSALAAMSAPSSAENVVRLQG